MPPHAERNTPDHAHKSQDRSIRLPASSCTTTICRSPSRGVDGLRSHPRASRGRSMQDPASELPRISLPRTTVNKQSKRCLGKRFIEDSSPPSSISLGEGNYSGKEKTDGWS